MPRSILSVLKEKGVLSPNKEPMKRGEYDLTGGVPIVEIPRGSRGTVADFIIYDRVTSPNGEILIQGTGKAYHGSVDDGELRFEVQRTENPHPIGAIGRTNDDYYLANRTFVDDLSTKL